MMENIISQNGSNHSVNLQIDEDDNKKYYTITCRVRNNAISLSKIVGIDLFTLLGVLNKDIFEKVHIISKNNNETEAQVVVIYKHFGKELGIPRQYGSFLITKEVQENKILIKSITTSCPKQYIPIGNSKALTDDDACLSIILDDDDCGGGLLYKFSVYNESVPACMKNMAGILMKKMFIRLKIFLEQINTE